MACALLVAMAAAVAPGAADASGVAAGSQHSVVVTPAGAVWTWGANSYGQLGDGTTTRRAAPVLLASPIGVQTVAAGQSHTVALTTDGTVWAWGYNYYGQIGDGSTTLRSTPVSVLQQTVAIAAGGSHTLAVKSDGTVWAWGYNYYGQLGDGTTTQRNAPTQVQGLTGIVAVAAGMYHSLALGSDGTVWAWGYNGYGNLGDGTSTQRTTPVHLTALAGVRQLAAGQYFGLALTTTGAVWAWGNNSYGQLGDGTFSQRTQPTAASITGVASIAAGQSHSVAVKTDGTVWTWGANSSRQLGDGTTTNRPAPVNVLPAAASVAAGDAHTLAITSDGVVWSWGSNASSQLGDGTTVAASGPIAVSEAGFTWKVATPAFSASTGTYTTVQNVSMSSATAGAFIYYTTDGADPTESSTLYSGPVLVDHTTTLKARAWKSGMPASNVASAVFTMQVATPSLSPGGGTYTSAVTVAVSVSTAGAQVRYTTDGTDPTESSTLYSAPLTLSSGVTVKVKAFKTDWSPSATNTATYAFSYGTVATPVASPPAGLYTDVQIVTLTTSAGASIRYTTDGSEPTTTSSLYAAPISITQTTTLKAKGYLLDWTTSATLTAVYTLKAATPTLSVASGAYAAGGTVIVSSATPGAALHYTLNGIDPTVNDPVVPSGGTLVLGNYTLKVAAWRTGWTTSDITAAAYTITGDLTAPRVAAGDSHSIALRPDGTVWAWGYNGYGQLGDGTTSQRSQPTMVAALTGVRAIAGGQSHSVALTTDGTVWTWGYNGYGQLGDGTTTQRKTPVAVFQQAIAIAAGASFTIAVKSDGTVWAWGYNYYGQLGDGTTTQRLSPVQVTGLSDVAAVAAGMYHGLALTTAGAVWAWGYNSYGQLGDATTTQRLTAVQITALSGVAAIAAGSYHSLAATTDGTLWTWGSNGYGQLGDGTTTGRQSPTRVTAVDGVSGIASGQSHSLFLRGDGSVWTCGYNQYGQLGDGTTTQHPTPVALATPSGVSGIAAGSSHSLAVTSDGVIWAWGYNGYGQLGDGTTAQRLAPVAISDPDLGARVATPTFSPGPSTYSTNQSVTISTVTAGATIHYTVSGADPTESDSIASSPVVIDRTTTLKAKAWKTGLAASGTGAAAYVLQVVAPVLTPGTGTYTSAQNVTMTDATAGAEIRYTMDGTDPTVSSTLYTAPVTAGTALTLKAKAFKTDWAASNTTTATYAFNFGTGATPVATPGSGTYFEDQAVTLTAAAGATIRYTTNGSDPTTSSAVFTSPIPVTATTTLKAKAYQQDWSPSPTLTAVYTMKVATPTLSAPAGIYAPGDSVIVSTATSGAILHYTTNGADPTATDPAIASDGRIALGGFTLKVAAWRTGWTTSDVATATYQLNSDFVTPQVAAGQNHSLALKSDGTVWAWGSNTYGQLGDTTTTQRTSPAIVAGLSGVKAIAAGQSHSVALTADGTVWTWGYNYYGQLGDGSTTQRKIPVAVFQQAVAIAAGQSHTVVLKSDGTVWAWGYNGYGQLGDDTYAQRQLPVQVRDLSSIVGVAAGASHSVAVGSNGHVWTWGDNSLGQLGTVMSHRTPFEMYNFTNVVAIAAGSAHSLAILDNASLWTWGYNNHGQLGDGTTTTQNGQTRIYTPGTVLRIAGGQSHSLVVDGGATVWATGFNGSGQIGDGTTTERLEPVQIAGPSGVVSVAGGASHSIAITSDDVIWTWGDNSYGQLGNGSTAGSTVPAAINASASSRAAKPTFSVVAGTYTAVKQVTIATATPGAAIHYTTNGADPTENDPIASEAITVERPVTLKARAWKEGLSPSYIATAAYVLAPAMPVPSLPTGTYFGTQTITIAESTDGCELRYTLDGTEPTETSTLYTAPVVVTASATLKAKGFRANWAPGGTMTAVYAIYSGTLTAPTMSPEPNVFFVSQVTVTMSAETGAAIHYTTDLSQPTESSPVYRQPLVFTSTAYLKAKAFRVDALPSETAIAYYYVMVATPVATPPPGRFSSTTPVTLTTTTPGATIRYTLDGSDPTEQSTLYTAPVQVTETTTLKARGFKTGCEPSEPLAANYAISTDETPPTITAQVTPPPNVAGWNNSDATVTFTCADAQSGIASCTLPQTVWLSRAENLVTGAAVDRAGNVATIAVTVNLDKTPPRVNTYAPADGDFLPPGATSATVRGNATDAVSGIESVTCNGVPVTLAGQNYACEVPLKAGPNTVHVVATDRAGFTAACDLTLNVGDAPPPTKLQASPAAVTMVAGETREIRVLDDRGRPVDDGKWHTSDKKVAEVKDVKTDTKERVPMLVANGPGTATLTLSRDKLIATMEVTVLADATLPPGTVLWTLAGAAPIQGDILRAVPTERTDGLESPSLFYVERGDVRERFGMQYGGWRLAPPTRIRAVTLDGRELWTYTTPVPPPHIDGVYCSTCGEPVTQVAADNRGGVVIVTGFSLDLSNMEDRTVRRLDGATGAVSWEYTVHSQSLSEVAIHPDGTVFFVEKPDYATYLVALDGDTGAVKARLTLESWQHDWDTATTTQPIVREDGSVNLVVFSHRTKALTLFTVPDGTLGLTGENLTYSDPDGNCRYNYGCPLYVFNRLVPDRRGGFLLAGTGQHFVYRIANGTLSGPMDLLSENPRYYGWFDTQFLIGEDAAYALLTRYSISTVPMQWKQQLVKFDPVTLSILGVLTPPGEPNATLRFAVQGGGVAYTSPLQGNGEQIWPGLMTMWSGIPDTTWPPALAAAAAPPSPAPVAVAGPMVRVSDIDVAPHEFARPGGNEHHANAARHAVNISLNFTAAWDLGLELNGLDVPERQSVQFMTGRTIQLAFGGYGGYSYADGHVSAMKAFGYAVDISFRTIADSQLDMYHRRIDIDSKNPDGANGDTPQSSLFSNLHMGAVYNSFLSALDCGGGKQWQTCRTAAFSDLEQQTLISRQQLVMGLGRGAGATGVHEIGHQRKTDIDPPVHDFAVHTSTCGSCYSFTLPEERGARYSFDYFFRPGWWPACWEKFKNAGWPR